MTKEKLYKIEKIENDIIYVSMKNFFKKTYYVKLATVRTNLQVKIKVFTSFISDKTFYKKQMFYVLSADGQLSLLVYDKEML